MDLFHLAGGIGVVCTLVGLWRCIANFRFIARSTAVEGHLVKWDITEAGKIGGPDSKDGRRSYRPIVAFKAADGSEHQVTGAAYRQAFHKPDTPTGSRFSVRYIVANPSDAQVVTFTDFWLFPIATFAVGIMSLVIAATA